MRIDPSYWLQLLEQHALQPGATWARKFARLARRVLYDYTSLQALALWTAAVVTGFVAVGYASAFRIVEEEARKMFEATPWLPLVATPIAFLISWWLVRRFAPDAGGSGIPQVIASVDIEYPGPKSALVDRMLSLKTAGIKVLSSLSCLAGGGAIGREGPTLQISAAIFHLFGKVIRRAYPKADEQTWVIAGAAAGLASAFNTPLGGIVYAIEELGMKHFHRVRTALLTAVIISGVVAQSVLGNYLYLGLPHLKTFTFSLWPFVLLTGAIAGIFGALFSRVLLRLVAWRAALKSVYSGIAITIGSGLGAAGLLYFSSAFSGPGSDVISDILFEGKAATFTMTAGRMAATALAYIGGGAGGIFSPSLTIGACLGSKLAYLFGVSNVNLLAMLGMIGFLTGITHTPFTAFILVLEMSDRHSAIFPMMVTALVAHGCARLVQPKSFYECVKDRILRTP